VERVDISEIEMRNRTVITIGVAAMLAFTGFLYQRTRAESTTFEVLMAGTSLKAAQIWGLRRRLVYPFRRMHAGGN
jgi:hypothetical protein